MNLRLLAVTSLAALSLSACSGGVDDQKFCSAAGQWQVELNAIGETIAGLAGLQSVVDDPSAPAVVSALREAANEIDELVASAQDQLAIAIANTSDPAVQEAFQGANDIVFTLARGFAASARDAEGIDAFAADTLDDLEAFGNRSEEYQSMLRTVGSYGEQHCPTNGA